MSWQQKMCFIREPNMIQEVWIVFDCVTKPFTHGYAFFHVRLRKFLLYLDFVRIQMKIWFKNMPQRLSWDSQLLTASSKWFLWTPAHWVPYSINVPFCPSTHPPTRLSVPQAFRIKILHSPILSELLNPVKDSAFWWSMMTPKLSPKICLHYHVWFVGEIGLHAKCLFLGWPRHVGEDYCPNISCTKSTCMPWKRKEVILKLTALFKDLWVLFFLGVTQYI